MYVELVGMLFFISPNNIIIWDITSYREEIYRSARCDVTTTIRPAGQLGNRRHLKEWFSY